MFNTHTHTHTHTHTYTHAHTHTHTRRWRILSQATKPTESIDPTTTHRTRTMDSLCLHKRVHASSTPCHQSTDVPCKIVSLALISMKPCIRLTASVWFHIHFLLSLTDWSVLKRSVAKSRGAYDEWLLTLASRAPPQSQHKNHHPTVQLASWSELSFKPLSLLNARNTPQLKPDKYIFMFSSFNCCLTIVLSLEKGARPEIWHVLFCRINLAFLFSFFFLFFFSFFFLLLFSSFLKSLFKNHV